MIFFLKKINTLISWENLTKILIIKIYLPRKQSSLCLNNEYKKTKNTPTHPHKVVQPNN